MRASCSRGSSRSFPPRGLGTALADPASAPRTARRAGASTPSDPPPRSSPTTRSDAADAVTIGSLCTGYGGLDLGADAALDGARLAWTADADPDITRLLAARFPHAPNLGDLTTINWAAAAPVDVVTAGFPCQDISSAGPGTGIAKGERSGLWKHVIRAVRHLRPALLLLENVDALRWRGRGLDTVLADLAHAGYDAHWASVRASDIGACHRRQRVFIAAHPRGQRQRPGLPAAAQAGRPAPGAPVRCGLRPARHREHGAGARAGGPSAAAHTLGQRSHQGQRPHARIQGRSGAVGDRGAAGHHPHCTLQHRPLTQHPARAPHPAPGAWGAYTEAIHCWERASGRAAPAPTEPGRRGNPRISAAFVEWMMGLEPGWVTDPDLGLARTAQLRALGNGVVPQQAAHAVRLLFCDRARTQEPRA